MASLHVTSSLAPRDGGPSTAITHVSKALDQYGKPSLILSTLADGRKASLDFDTTRVLLQGGATVWYSRRSRPHMLKNSWRLGLRTIRLAALADVIHIHGMYQANSIYGYLASKLAGTPYIIQPHGGLEPYQQKTRHLRKRVFNLLIGDRIMNQSSGIISSSKSEREHIESQYPGLAIHVISPGVRTENPKRPMVSNDDIDRWLDQPTERRVLFLGRLAKVKRPDLLVKAWALTKESGELLIAGPPEDWNEILLRALVDEKTNSRITFLPTLNRSEVAWVLSKAGIIAMPSASENFGIAVAEAMFYRCAVVLSATAAVAEHVKRANAGIVLNHTDDATLAEALTACLSNPQRTMEYAHSAHQYAHANLTWEATAGKLQGIYDELTQSRFSTCLWPKASPLPMAVELSENKTGEQNG